jgi:hypothetical protein
MIVAYKVIALIVKRCYVRQDDKVALGNLPAEDLDRTKCDPMPSDDGGREQVEVLIDRPTSHTLRPQSGLGKPLLPCGWRFVMEQMGGRDSPAQGPP